jgi:hypothetical protein
MEKTSHTHPEINRLLQNITKYVSKPFGFEKIYMEEKHAERKKGIHLIH